jgi:hypothetical protein
VGKQPCLFPQVLKKVTKDDFSEGDEIFLLIVCHCGHGVGGGRVKGEDVEDATAVEEDTRVRSACHQDFSRILDFKTYF